VDDNVNVRNLTWIDYDRDGDLDLHVLAKGDTQNQNQNDILYRNRTTYFSNETSEQFMQGPSNGLADACAWEDYDDDGDLDVAILSGSPPRVYTIYETDRLYRNDTTPRYELRVNLEGVASNRDGLGAWVTCYSDYAGTQSHFVTANSWRGGQVMLDAYFALRWDATVDELRVKWPSGIENVFYDVPAGDVTVTEANAALSVEPFDGDGEVLRLAVRRNPTPGPVAFEVGGMRGGAGDLEIFDPSGRRVYGTRFDATPGRLEWSGIDADGRRVANGVYYAVLREGERTATTKVVLVR
jgi:hypothetical protein